MKQYQTVYCGKEASRKTVTQWKSHVAHTSMSKMLNYWNQYCFNTDVFDTYREAVKRSNRSSIRVLSCMAVAAGIVMLIFGHATKQARPGFYFCLFVLAAGIAGAVASFRKESTRQAILAAGYILSLSIHLIAIYGAVTFKTDAFWIGTQIAVGCYLFDYAGRVGLLQICSFLGLVLAWMASPDIHADGTRILFCNLFLIVSLITFYTQNRTRASMILSREKTKKASETDLLTGLTARIAAQQEIEEQLQTDEHGVMMLLDLDRFKYVNDRLGHQMGDKVLIDVAGDMKKLFRNSDVLSRLGGDEFVVYLKSVPEKDWAEQRASDIVREIRRWVSNGTTNIQITASVGIVMTDMVERSYDALYRAADIAMYTAKGQGGNQALLYTPEMAALRENTERILEEAPGRNGASTKCI